MTISRAKEGPAALSTSSDADQQDAALYNNRSLPKMLISPFKASPKSMILTKRDGRDDLDVWG
jgi:hypothetical protein